MLRTRASSARWLTKTACILLIMANSISPSLAAAGIASNTVPPSANSKAARDLLDAIVGAYGGPEIVKRHHENAMRTRGSLSCNSTISPANNTQECEVLQKGDKMRISMNLMGTPLVMGYDGKNSWTRFADWTSINGPIATSMVCESITHGLPILANTLAPATKLILLPRTRIDGKMCDVLQVTLPSGKETTLFADTHTHLIQRADYIGLDPETAEPKLQSLVYDDYRTVDGAPEPYHIVQYSENKKKMETVVNSVESGVSAEDASFQTPEESQIARLKDGPIQLPFEYTNEKIVVTARINSGPELHFLLDTGSSQTVIDKSVAASLGGNTTKTYSVTTGTKSMPMSFATLPTLSMGDLTINDVPVLITDLSGIARGISGLLGANILKRFAVTLDFDNRMLTLSDPRSVTVPPNAHVLPASPVFGGNQLIVQGKLDGKVSTNFLLDTGTSFNNLPKQIASSVYHGTPLPTQTVSGLGGVAVSAASIKLHSLKLGDATVPDPVFRLVVDSPSSKSGLLASESMGILGNSIWSQFKTTVDYRNERIILEPQPGHEKFVALLNQLHEADLQYLKTKDIDAAIKAYEKVKAQAATEQVKTAEGLALARLGGCSADRFAENKDNKWIDEATLYYERGNKLASEAHNRKVEGEILAQWGMMYFNSPRTQNDISAGQALIGRAMQKAPLDAGILAALGTIMLRLGKKTEANKFLNNALSADPSNWQALWSKYKLSTEDNNVREQQLTAEQLAYYYPTMPEVTAIARGMKLNKTRH